MDISVPENGSLILDAEHPGAEVAPAAVQHRVTRLQDYADLGLVREEHLTRMLAAARESTADALSNPGRPGAFVPGTRRPDLGRYTGYTSRLAEVNTSEARLVWNALRAVEPRRLGAWTLSDRLPGNLGPIISGFRFADITVAGGGQLIVAPGTRVMWAGDIVVAPSGRIVVQGASLTVRAHSFRGQ
ncbi:hypothetical protein Dcar01_02594 [Deinococcus carri]|uniref:DUF1707 domain-containing protein n=1 Tax=Deinococcus carri TaxID=1211323 RepID=A0ABP9WA02_9DEIO